MSDDELYAHAAVDTATLIGLFGTTPVIDALAVVEQRHGDVVGELDAWIWDHQHLTLCPLRRADTTVSHDVVEDHFGDLVTAPISVLGDDIGVLAARVADAGERQTAEALIEGLAPLVALAIRSCAPIVDTIPIKRRRREMALPAEIQWSLLPPTELHLGPISLSAAIEPAYETGGDVFDYALDGRTLFLCVLDAMGHGLRAAQLSTLAVSALRRVRRNGGSLVEMASEVSASVAAGGSGDFVSAVMAEIDLVDWTGNWLSAGHLPPMIASEQGQRELDLEPTLPLGMQIGDVYADPKPQHFELPVGSTLVLYSDGIIENAMLDDRQPVGERRFAEALDAELASGRPAEARRVVERLIAHTGPDMRDDATLMVLRHGR